ncbi:amidohydrolase family protein [Aestuariirhabdus sp. Z084]|uniref:amidohydrolase family protein n=1 Tax=Aestuariirhabdus haliotis TaxID=2918751 RepID=UPI00201B3926|nr:amidohydrolase family protein [Aestuariirhabdus haliotis]MCL6417689.1 amidohydrolase family protein [Aestuariirhabdus haliotis]MCL6421628.1 amidohydrolase family protein [Aestuariirhabdus haliotis]
MKVIDVWAQQPTQRFIAQPYFDSLKKWTGNDFNEVPLQWLLHTMEKANVSRALLAAWYGPQGSLISNEEVLEVINQQPDKFYGLASADIRNPVESVRTLRKYVRDHDFKGLRIVQWVWELPCTHALYYPLLTECVELDIPVCLQVGHTGPLRSSESGRPADIERIALDFPELKIVCGHIGYPWTTEMIAVATKFPNVYIDTSAYVPKRYPQELVSYMKAHGKKKVLFGTNYPMISADTCMDQLEPLALDEEVLACFLYKNAETVFKL